MNPLLRALFAGLASGGFSVFAPTRYRNASVPPSKKPVNQRTPDDWTRLIAAQEKRMRKAAIYRRNEFRGAFDDRVLFERRARANVAAFGAFGERPLDALDFV